MRTLYFQQIADSRFCDDIEMEIKSRMTLIRESLNKPGIELITNTFRHISFPDGTNQVRVDCYVNKGQGITWNNVYALVNKINAVPYKFVH